jgi:hypothetical protein
MWHPSCYSCYKPGDKTRMRKGIKLKQKKKYHTVVTVPNFNRIRNRGKALSLTHICDQQNYWLGPNTSIKGGGVVLVLWVQNFPLSDIKRSYTGIYKCTDLVANWTYKLYHQNIKTLPQSVHISSKI